MVAGGALYARHPGRRPATAVRAASVAGRHRPSTSSAVLAPAGAASAYDLVSDLRTGTVAPTTLQPTTTVPAAKRPAAAGPTTSTTTAPAAAAATPPTTAAAAAPGAGDTAVAANPLAPLLQKLVPAAAAVLGVASWFDAPAGTCAHRDLPLGTLVTVTRTATGASTTCRVSDRGPSLATNRLIDLSQDTFAKLASPDAGVIEVRIEW